MTSAGTRVGGHSAADATGPAAAPHPGVTDPVVPSGAERGAGIKKKGLAAAGLGLLTVAMFAGRRRRRTAGDA